MINAIDTEALLRIIPKNLPGFYEVSKFDDGSVIIVRHAKAANEDRFEEKPKDGSVSDARLTD
jgi:hypothetical protein